MPVNFAGSGIIGLGFYRGIILTMFFIIRAVVISIVFIGVAIETIVDYRYAIRNS